MSNTNTMRYRRFGRTELQMPVLSCGGMRYQQKWGEFEPDDITPENQANVEATVHRALELGINHIETARGYGSSEYQLGRILPKLPREQLIVQTKVGPNEDPKQFLETFNKSMNYLQLEYVDLLAFHGMSTIELLNQVVLRNGCMKIARQLQREGRVRFVGFSTHGSCGMIQAAARTTEFDYMNVHWYFVNDLNWPAIEEATKVDMGVFIISPNDKGGKLYEPPAKMVDLCQPLTPMQFNDLYCLQRPQVHTLSIGAARPTDFDEHVEALAYYDQIPETIGPIEQRLREEMMKVWGEDWTQRWSEGLPDHHEVPGDINVLEILRLWTYAKSLDLVEWGKMRYNLLGNGGHWFPGQTANGLDEESEIALAPALTRSPFAARIPQVLREAHEMLAGEEQKRLSQS
ncbi:MAG: aldo/keto reductase [Abitibacteriaceae bacterium]|nr:aldo/keto reductase [Abditibacteriaceae bacterium]